MSRSLVVALCGLCIGGSASWAQTPAPAQGAQTEEPESETQTELGKGAYIGGAPAELSAEEAAKELANPNTPLASLTLKTQSTRWDGSLPGADGLDSQTILFQPSFPFPISATDTIFLRPAFPYLVDQPVVDASGTVHAKSGFGDE